MTDKKLLRQKHIEDLLGLPRSTMYLKVKQREFPEPIKIGCCSYWLVEEVDAYINERIRARG